MCERVCKNDGAHPQKQPLHAFFDSVDKDQKAAKLNFKKMQRLSVPPVGQLLLVTQVSGSTRPRTLQQQLLLATAAGRG